MQPSNKDIKIYQENGMFEIYRKRTLIAKFKLECMPSCCALCVLNDIRVYQENGTGWATVIVKMAEEIAIAGGYSAMIATDAVLNKIHVRHLPPIHKTLKGLDYRVVDEQVINNRTGKTIFVYMKNLNTANPRATPTCNKYKAPRPAILGEAY